MYTVQVHGEWSDMPDVIDEDYEFETLDAARRFIQNEMVKGCIYVLAYEDDTYYETIEEGTA